MQRLRRILFVGLVSSAGLVFFSSLILGHEVTRASGLPVGLQQPEKTLPDGSIPLDAWLRFNRLSTEDGLSQNSISAMLQDRRGFLWLGTPDGLDRYDGYGFTVFKFQADDPNSLSNNNILSLAETSDGMIWIGTKGGGLNRYDPSNGQFTRYQHDPDRPDSLAHDLVSAIHEDRAGRLWIGTMGGGLDEFERASGSFIHHRSDPAKPASLSSDFISAILEDGDGGLWLGSGGLGMAGRGLIYFNPESNHVSQYRHNPADPYTLSSDSISSLALGPDGDLWIGTGGLDMPGAGLSRLDPASGRVTRFLHDPADPESLGNDRITALFVDPSQVLWIGTAGGGLDRLDLRAAVPRFIHDRHDPYLDFSLSADAVWSILQDHSGVYWIGTLDGGLNKLDAQVQRFRLYRHHPQEPDSLSHDEVGAFFEDTQGGLWVGTVGGGLDFIAPQTNSFVHYRHDLADTASLPDNNVRTILQDSRGVIWVGTDGGLSKFDPERQKFRTYEHIAGDPTSLVDSNISGLVEDDVERLWIGTPNGLNIYDQERDQFLHVELPASLHVAAMIVDRNGTLWVGTRGQGLVSLDPANLTERNADLRGMEAYEADATQYLHDPRNPDSLRDDTVWAVYEDERGMLWIGTQSGLDRFDRFNDTFVHFPEQETPFNNAILCILEDDAGLLWISTDNGLIRFDPLSRSWRLYSTGDGLQSNQFNPGACRSMSDSKMVFGGANGYNLFDPDEILPNPIPPPVAITTFSIFNEPIAIDLSGNKPVNLTYRQNFISFDFAGLDFHAPDRNHYRYMLEGVDKGWVEAGTRRFASYPNLSGGDYIFRVTAANSDGVWNEVGLALPLKVTPPPWQAWWFQGGVALIGILLLSGGLWLRNNQARAQNRRLEREVEQRTSDLRRVNERLAEEAEQRKRIEAELARRAAEEAVALERNRLAHELHDAVTQTLFSASLTAEILPRIWEIDPGEALKVSEELRQLTRGALAEMRTLLVELRPAALTQARFEDLLRQLANGLTVRADLPINLNVQGTRRLPAEVQLAFYRIAQESLNNAVKYAQASQVVIDVQMSPGGVYLEIRDDGIGFNPQDVRPTSFGQKIMRERAEDIGAELQFKSAPGTGTTVAVTWNDTSLDNKFEVEVTE